MEAALIESRIGRGGVLSTIKEGRIGKSLPDFVQSEDKEEAKATDEPIGNASPGVFPGWNKGKQTWSVTKMIGEQELFIWHVVRPMRQSTRNTCLLVSAVMCVEGLHRRAYETEHGLGTFPLIAKSPKKLMEECFYDYDATKDERVWNFDGVVPKKAAQVFEKIRKDGLPTENYDIRLHISGWKMHGRRSLEAKEVKRRLREEGPFIGILFTTSEYYELFARSDGGWNGSSFPGFPTNPTAREEITKIDANAGLHAVVCDGFWHHGRREEELRIRIKDNLSEDDGPIRWVNFRAFDCIFTFTVKVLSGPLIPATDPPVIALDSGTKKEKI